jgi:hypothetical protein
LNQQIRFPAKVENTLDFYICRSAFGDPGFFAFNNALGENE